MVAQMFGGLDLLTLAPIAVTYACRQVDAHPTGRTIPNTRLIATSPDFGDDTENVIKNSCPISQIRQEFDLCIHRGTVR